MTPNEAVWWAILQELREPVTVLDKYIVYVHTADNNNGLDLTVLDPRTEQITHHKITVEDAEVSDGQ